MGNYIRVGTKEEKYVTLQYMADELKTYDSVLAAKFLMALANSKGVVLNVTKVQKLLYIIYGFFLASANHKIINESPQAWPFGPVFPRTRNKVDYSKIINLDDAELSEINQDPIVKKIFSEMVDGFLGISANKLSKWSHTEGSPWDITRKKEGFKWSDTISDELITEYFKPL